LASWAADSLGSGPVEPRLRQGVHAVLEAGVPETRALAGGIEFVGDVALGPALVSDCKAASSQRLTGWSVELDRLLTIGKLSAAAAISTVHEDLSP
jgi:hypothetical protein